MKIAQLLSLVDNKLKDVFHTPAFDAEKARKPILAKIDTAKQQFLTTSPQRGRKAWKASNNVIEYTAPVAIGDSEVSYIPSERFVEFLDGLRAAVESGELDKQIETGVSTTASAAKAPRKPRADAGASRQGWSQSRREAFAATVAARKAAKAETK